MNTPTKLTVTKSQQQKMITHAEQGYPHEVVGILAGNREQHHVSRIQPLINERADTKNRYKVSPLLLMRQEQALERQGLEIVGYYHSHPDHPAKYSEYDKEHALPNMSYLILSVLNGKAQAIQSWRICEDRTQMTEELIDYT